MTQLDPISALIFGGTGAVGTELVRVLTSRGCRVAFTYGRAAVKAASLATETGALALQVELADPACVTDIFARLDGQGFLPHVLIYAAAESSAKPLLEITPADWARLDAINCHSAWAACQEFARRVKPGTGGQILFLGALDRTQSLPLPAAFAATQGKLSAMAMALGKELGPRGICVNLVALSALDEGMSRNFDPRLLEEFRKLSALRRLGRPTEAARSIAWLALQNTYMTGQVFPVNGGI